ncbi:MAG: cobalamin biosynthesis protein, partial [Mogibacterium sp.]|nr:cobalamin biosynthesis protein [Mogibacterium sp.]
MRIKILYFTDKGKALAERLKEELAGHEAVIVPKGAPLNIVCGDAFVDNEALVFIGAAGIAVRTIAPLVRDKLKDPPVIVIDENGDYVIPILSGHVGGANSLAAEIADALGAQPVITTATDVSRAFSVDVFAKENGLKIANREGIAKVSSSALEGKPVTICIKDYPPEEPVDVLIADEEAAEGLRDSAKIVLCPKNYAIGMGCRRGRSFEELKAFAEEVLQDNGIDINDAGCIATIDVKKDEEGLKRLSQAWRMPLITFDAG